MRTTILTAALLLLLASCGGEPADPIEVAAPSPSTAAAPSAAAPSSPAPASSSSSQFLRATEQNGRVTIAMMVNGEPRELYGDPRDSGKRKYTVGDGAVEYEVKPNDDGFKLRTADGKLRWKVKVTPEKIKISDNEENKNPFELKVRDGGRVKVVAPGDRELGNVRYVSGKAEVEAADGTKVFSTAAAKPTGAYGVLLLDSIPEHERYILIAEILARGR